MHTHIHTSLVRCRADSFSSTLPHALRLFLIHSSSSTLPLSHPLPTIPHCVSICACVWGCVHVVGYVGWVGVWRHLVCGGRYDAGGLYGARQCIDVGGWEPGSFLCSPGPYMYTSLYNICIPIFIHIHVHIYMYIFMCIYIHIYIYVHTYVYIHIYIYTYIYINICV